MKPGTFFQCRKPLFYSLTCIPENDILLCLEEKIIELPLSNRIEDPDGMTTETYLLSMSTGKIIVIDRFDLLIGDDFMVYEPSS